MKHIILIGFKNAGKSTIGKALAQELNRTFLDLDEKIREIHADTGTDADAARAEKISCRKIMELYGEEHFRKLEHRALTEVIQTLEPMVLAVGGGTPMPENNRELLGRHVVVQISAPKSIVFERIMINGKPAFFPQDREPFESFQKLWSEREPVFQKLADITVENTGSVEKAVAELKSKLNSNL